ncbi:site-2 protease family protein [Acetivibrio cellulolyticus]|uniref:site-2 protease family protein n=1 Tax=Acetivibrio cellulolyticus TaxID=35830 RepID=UPI0001E2F144|nr:site-2 protease family protein [Acetivibrio cellulolyticus]
MINYLPGQPLMLVISILMFVMSITLHEFSHGFSAYLLGDPTAKNQGRLTLNPIKHMDPLGTIMILFTSFGWAKPVQVNATNFEDRKKGMMITSLAGPLSNLLLSFVFAFPYVYFATKGYYNSNVVMNILYKVFQVGFSMNITLGIFNMLPVSPLDGSKILYGFLPSRHYYKMLEYENYITIGFVILMFTGILGRILNLIISPVATGILYLVSTILGLFM